MKGLKKGDLQGVIEEGFEAEIGLKTIDKVKFRLPTSPGLTRATILVTIESQEKAYRACKEGVV